MQPTLLLSLSREFLSHLNNIKKDEILTLREVIREHNRLYHIDESPIISDTEYDQLFHALARSEADYGMLDEDSPTAQLAILASEQFQKVAHIYPMISLDNTYSLEDVRDWNERMLRILSKANNEQGTMNNDEEINRKLLSVNCSLQYYIQPKYDGLGLAVIYRYGKFEQAVTRGSGVEGEDVTLTALEIEGLPKEIPALKDIERMEIRGEVMLSRTEFDRVNRERLESGDKLFANPRNCASGSLRQLDPLVTRSRRLQFFSYAIPQIEQEGMKDARFKIQNYSELMNLLGLWGFERKDFPFRVIDGLDELLYRIDQETKNRREYFDFDIDGMVLKLDDMTLWDELGRTEHHPRYAIAYKFPAKQVRTQVLSIEHSVGRTGTVTPVANLAPVDAGGVIVRRATLHNYDELAKKGVREGDQVFIMRAGEVIPEIVSVITELRDGSEVMVKIPTICPVCSTSLEQDEGKVAVYCPNPHCPAKIQGQLEMFVSKQGMNIDGLGVKQIELFLELGWITDFASVFQLGDFADELLKLEGYKEKSVQNLIESLEKARHTTLDRVFTAIGIPNVGKKTAKVITSSVIARNSLVSVISTESSVSVATTRDLAQENIEQDCSEYRAGFLDSENHRNRFSSLEMTEQQKSILDSIFSISESELLEARDIGPETARSFVSYMEENREAVERLFAQLEIASPPAPLLKERGAILGQSFCVTGSFDTLSRDEIHELVEKNGGEVRTSVSAKLDYLIAGDNAGSKKQKAEECGVNIISLSQFLEMIA